MEEDLDDDEEEEVDVFPKPMAERFILRLERLETALQLTMSDVGGPKKTCNVSAVSSVSTSAREGREEGEEWLGERGGDWGSDGGRK